MRRGLRSIVLLVLFGAHAGCATLQRPEAAACALAVSTAASQALNAAAVCAQLAKPSAPPDAGAP